MTELLFPTQFRSSGYEDDVVSGTKSVNSTTGEAIETMDDLIPGRVKNRINVANGQTRYTPVRTSSGEPVSAGFEHVIDGHFNRPLANNRSIFSISPDDLATILQRDDVIHSSVSALDGGQFVRTVDVGEIVGNTSLKYGGDQTTWIKIFTDETSNLITTYPVPGK